MRDLTPSSPLVLVFCKFFHLGRLLNIRPDDAWLAMKNFTFLELFCRFLHRESGFENALTMLSSHPPFWNFEKPYAFLSL
jgi:hypothetical protein